MTTNYHYLTYTSVFSLGECALWTWECLNNLPITLANCTSFQVGATSPETPNQSESPTDATWTNDSDFEDLDSTSTVNSTTVRKSSFGDSEQSNLDHSIPRTSSNKLALKSPKSTGNPLKLGRVKTAPAKPQVKHKSNQPRRALGEEFEIKQTAATSAELDFFADMEPDVTFDSFETAESVAASKYGSALAVSKNNLQVSILTFMCNYLTPWGVSPVLATWDMWYPKG